MKILTNESLIETVIDRWNKMYCGMYRTYPDKKQIYQRLVALGKQKSDKKITEIIGNPSWTRYWCNICEQYVTSIIALEDDNGTNLCLDCARKIAKLVMPESIEAYNEYGELCDYFLFLGKEK